MINSGVYASINIPIIVDLYITPLGQVSVPGIGHMLSGGDESVTYCDKKANTSCRKLPGAFR